jgi:hypothetical protein
VGSVPEPRKHVIAVSEGYCNSKQLELHVGKLHDAWLAEDGNESRAHACSATSSQSTHTLRASGCM